MPGDQFYGIEEKALTSLYKVGVLYATKKLRHPKFFFIQCIEATHLEPVEVVTDVFVAFKNGTRTWDRTRVSLAVVFQRAIDSVISNHINSAAVKTTLEVIRKESTFSDESDDGGSSSIIESAYQTDECPAYHHEVQQLLDIYKERVQEDPQLKDAMKILNSPYPIIDFDTVADAFHLDRENQRSTIYNRVGRLKALMNECVTEIAV